MKKIFTIVGLFVSLFWFPVSAHSFTISFEQSELIYNVVLEESENCQTNFQIACDILDYLRSNPDASDSIEGVATSWLEGDNLSASSEDVNGVSTFSLDLENGVIRFGNGSSGARIPSGTSVTLGTYTYGGGSAGNVSTVNIYYFPAEFYPFLIPQDVFPTDDNGETVYDFLLSGVASMDYEIIGGDLYIARAEYQSAPVPEPATMILLGSGLIGVGAFRRKFKNRLF